MGADIFKGFDRAGEGKIPIQDFYRAFRAMGLPKRDGEKMEMDKKMFDSFDSNGDGFSRWSSSRRTSFPRRARRSRCSSRPAGSLTRSSGTSRASAMRPPGQR